MYIVKFIELIIFALIIDNVKCTYNLQLFHAYQVNF